MTRKTATLKKQLDYLQIADDDGKILFKYPIDYGDAELQGRAKKLYDYYVSHREAIDAVGDDEKSRHVAAQFYERIITEILGRDAFQEIVAYVRDTEITGTETADGILLLLTPVVLVLVDQISELLSASRARVRERYLGADSDGTVI